MPDSLNKSPSDKMSTILTSNGSVPDLAMEESESDAMFETQETSSDEDPVEPAKISIPLAIEALKTNIVQRILRTLPTFIASSRVWANAVQQHASGTAENPQSGQPDLSKQLSGSKRSVSNGDRGGDEDEAPDEGSNKRRKAQSTSTDSSSSQTRKLACPFFKKDPALHTNYNSCSGHGWLTVHRVK